MAQSVVSPFVEILLGKLQFLQNQNVPLEQGGDNVEIGKLKTTLSSIRNVLLDAEKRQRDDDGVRRCLKLLKAACYDAEDVLEELEIEALHKQLEMDHQYRSITTKVCDFMSCSKSPDLHFTKINKQIKEIREKLDAMKVNMSEFNFQNSFPDDNRNIRREREMSHSYMDASNDHVLERDIDKEDIITTLMENDDDVNTGIVTISGDSGIGKTTLAKLVYKDERIDSYFDIKMWACFSQKFVEKKAIIDMISSVTGRMESNMEMDQLKGILQDYLKSKRYLLVLDDVYSEDETKWKEFIQLISVGDKESRIIVTTSSNEVASMVGAWRQYTLDWLSSKSILSLFMKYAFEEGQEKNPALIEIGEAIAEKCAGRPLVVKLLASTLYFLTDEGDWKYVNNNLKWEQGNYYLNTLSVLQLSYDLLPPHLKQCFVYCSIFPRDYGFSNIILIQFWRAHGLLRSDDENEELESVGMRYIDELRWRCFFQDFEAKFDFISFKMHDLVYDLAIKIGKSESLALELMRNILFLGMKPRQSLVELCILNYPKLRALDLRNLDMEVLSESIGNLKHLRYLNLTKSIKMKRLPHSIFRLRYLETLLLGGCKELEELPKDVGYLVNLRMLVLSSKQTYLPNHGIGCLTSLRYLGIGSCYDLKHLFGDIDRLQALRTLIIWDCPSLVSLPRGVKSLSSLEKLMIYRREKISLSCYLNMEMVYTVQELRSKPHLRMLCIDGLREFHEFPEWLLQCSANTLQWLAIKNCRNFKKLPAEPLKILKSLELLEISNCPKLSSLGMEMDCFTALRELKIRDCPVLIKRITREDGVKISHIPKVETDGKRISTDLKDSDSDEQKTILETKVTTDLKDSDSDEQKTRGTVSVANQLEDSEVIQDGESK